MNLFAIDHSENYFVKIEYKKDDAELLVEVFPSKKLYSKTPLRFLDSLIENKGLFKLKINGKNYHLQKEEGKYFFRFDLSRQDYGDLDIKIFVGKNLIQQHTLENSKIESEIKYKLSVPLIKKIANNPKYEIGKISNSGYRYFEENYDDIRHVSTHSHFSGDDPRELLLQQALEYNLYIPRRFLDFIRLDYRKYNSQIKWEKQPTIFFFPKLHEQRDLPVEEESTRIRDLHKLYKNDGKENRFLKSIIDSLLIPVDEIRYQGGFEEVYEIGEFATKLSDVSFVADRMYNIALHRSKNENLIYSEFASGSILKKEFILAYQKTIEKLKQEKSDIKLYLKQGIARHMSNEQMMDLVDMAIAFHKTGHCCGIDVMGFEDNKTQEFIESLEYLGTELQNKNLLDSFVVQVHAGETNKNPSNVNQVLRTALKYGFRLNIGHSIKGWNNETLDLMRNLAKKEQIFVQLLHGSNICLSAISNMSEVPFKTLTENNISFGVDTDGEFYQSDFKELIFALVEAGADEKVIKHIVKSQNDYFDRQVKNMPKLKTLSSEEIEKIHDGLKNNQKYIAEVKDKYKREDDLRQENLKRIIQKKKIETSPTKIEKDLEGKVTILEFGATGSSWNDRGITHRKGLSEEIREEIIIKQELKIRLYDPNKVTFGTGRLKRNSGVAEELLKSIKRNNKNFYVVAYTCRTDELADNLENNSLFDGDVVNSIMMLEGGLLSLPKHIEEITSQDNFLINFSGGSRSTNDCIRCILNGDSKDNMLLMKYEGISGKYAEILPNEYSYEIEWNEDISDTLYIAENSLLRECEKYPEILLSDQQALYLNDKESFIKFLVEERKTITEELKKQKIIKGEGVRKLKY